MTATISTIQKREYVEKRDKEGTLRAYRILVLRNDLISQREESENTGAEKAKLFPTDLGLVVTDFLKQYFDDIMDYGFTARIEEEFDEVAEGKLQWNEMLEEFYWPFKKDVDNTMETAERAKGERILGTDPESGKPVIARVARYGPIIQIGSGDQEEKPRFAKVPTGQSIETITFEEALALFKLQDAMGIYEGKELSVNVGRFGPYVKWGDEFISIPRGTDLSTVDTEKAIEFIKAKQIADAPVGDYDGSHVFVSSHLNRLTADLQPKSGSDGHRLPEQLPLRELAQHVTDQDVPLLDPRREVRRNADTLVDGRADLASARSGHGNREQSHRPAGFDSSDDVSRVAAGRNAYRHVTGSRQTFELPGEHLLVSVIVADGRYGG